ncbi:MAG: FAD-dependent oxidoreductase [Oscillospiraceae bacterium]|jgi:thioredoxin reductase (NADPH)|nr:FAD-dependent oxidoreductase [Oscillospiraceae bacterium]
MEELYDVIILGGGPAGLTAGLYAGRGGLKTLLLEKGQDGGQIALTAELENYPGQLLEGETGLSLAGRMAEQCRRFGVERAADTIQSVRLDGPVKELTGERGTYRSRAVILATGAAPRPIGCENEARFVGQGISFCATCDGALFRGLEVYVAGGGDSAVEEAVYLTRFARKVTVIHRRDRLRAARSIQERAFANPKVAFLWDSVVVRAEGTDVLEAITVKNVKTGALSTLRADPADGMLGLFGFTGYTPNTGLFAGQLALEEGYIKTGEDMGAGLPGVFAAGDVRRKSLRQVVTACADGAVAAVAAERYLQAL